MECACDIGAKWSKECVERHARPTHGRPPSSTPWLKSRPEERNILQIRVVSAFLGGQISNWSTFGPGGDDPPRVNTSFRDPLEAAPGQRWPHHWPAWVAASDDRRLLPMALQRLSVASASVAPPARDTQPKSKGGVHECGRFRLHRAGNCANFGSRTTPDHTTPATSNSKTPVAHRGGGGKSNITIPREIHIKTNTVIHLSLAHSLTHYLFVSLSLSLSHSCSRSLH